jgi:RimJ/RimL family protein N-acetyltransferase
MADMSTRTDVANLVPLLEQDVLRNLVTLKMLSAYGRSMTGFLEREGREWASLSLLPTEVSGWDRTAYPQARFIAFPNGTNAGLMGRVLESLPDSPLVVKTGDEPVIECLRRGKGAIRVTAYRSFTGSASVEADGAPAVQRSSNRDEAAWALFAENGYDAAELDRHFSNGAQWFGVRNGQRLVSACLAFQNYGRIWEIGGVYTVPGFRKRGFARQVVLAAMGFLGERALTPRYQVKEDNGESIGLAQRCGLRQFLCIRHLAIGWTPREHPGRPARGGH